MYAGKPDVYMPLKLMMMNSVTKPFANIYPFRYWRDKKVAWHLEETLKLPLAGGSFVDPDRDIPLHVLRRLESSRSSDQFIHPIQRALDNLVIEGKQYAAVVRLDDIRGISATKGGIALGKLGFHMNLDRLPETMILQQNESYGPLSQPELDRLYRAVCSELPLDEKGLRLQQQMWDGTYIVMNDGASRRFALLRRLNPRRRIRALITPYSLCFDNIYLLRQKWRAAVILETPDLYRTLFSLADLQQEEFWVRPDVGKNMLLVAIPYLHRSANILRDPLSRLHRRFDEIGAFDVCRYLTEQISVPRSRVSATP